MRFHPDRNGRAGRTVAENLARDGVYRNQFETGTSNGRLTAHPGGDRYQWESRLFDGAYDGTGVAPGDRPIYGAVNLRRYINGAAPRFGSCVLRLRRDVPKRTTISASDSVFAADVPIPAAPSAPVNHSLDNYAEAHVHGGVVLGRDVEALVADASFRGPDIEPQLRSIAPNGHVLWIPALRIDPGTIPPDFRKPELPEFAAHVSRVFSGESSLDAAVIGMAANDVVACSRGSEWASGRWTTWGTPAECLQPAKFLWHAVVALS